MSQLLRAAGLPMLRASGLGLLWLCWAVSAHAGKEKAPVWEVVHEPAAPRSGQEVRIRVVPPAPVGKLTLEYQTVDPGRYCERADPDYRRNWAAVEFAPSSEQGTEVGYSVVLPADLQVHRRLVRYRFRWTDPAGNAAQYPSESAAVPNYAYFVDDGLPGWSGAINPRSTSPARARPVRYEAQTLARVQSYVMIAKESSVEKVTWAEQTTGKEYKHTCTLVVDGVVYDHVGMRARGERWRYQMGKNMWKFRLPEGQRLWTRDDYGRKRSVGWDHLILRGPIQWPDVGHRGEAGLFESVNFRLFALAGVPSSSTHWLQLRLISGEEESPEDQYRGDYWGLYLAIEEVDGAFLRARGLPDGNVYKMIRAGSSVSHRREGDDGADLQAFVGAYSAGARPERWWRENLNLAEYYSYRALCECIHHYDIGAGKNYLYYHNPADDLWQVIPWDLDLTWSDLALGSGDEPFYRRVLSRPSFKLEYRNRLRELRDLLLNPGELGRLIDECAAVIADPAGAPSPVDADRAKWDYHPMMRRGAKAGQGQFYRTSPTHDFPGVVRLMKDYAATRFEWIDTALLRDATLPATPTAVYEGPAGYAADRLSFRSSDYQGQRPRAAMEWRVAEVAPPTMVEGRPVAPGKYEITSVWASGELSGLEPTITLPDRVALPGRVYRVRARVKDASGRWSHWSAPIEFVAGARQS